MVCMTTTTLRPKQLPVAPAHYVKDLQKRDFFGFVTLEPIELDHDPGVTWVVRPGDRAAECFGAFGYGGKVIGGLTFLARSHRWCVTGYAEREHIFNGQGRITYFPDALSRAAGARCLLRWRNLLHTGRVQPTDNPFDRCEADQRWLVT